MKNQQNQQGNNQQSGQQGNQQGNQQGRSQTELDSIIRGGKWNSQQDANAYLQQHGLSCQMKDDGTAEIFEGSDQSKRIARVNFKQGQTGSISGIDY